MLLFVFELVQLSHNAQAQSAVDSTKLSLAEALHLASVHQADWMNARLQEQSTLAQVKETLSTYLPHVTAGADGRYNAIIPTTPVPATAFDPSAPAGKTLPLKFGTLWSGSASLSLDQMLLDPEELEARPASRLEIRMASETRQATALSVKERVMNQYAAWVLSIQQMAFEQAHLKLAIQDSSWAKARLDQDRILPYQWQQILDRLHEAEWNLQEARVDRLQAADALAESMGTRSIPGPDRFPSDSMTDLLRTYARSWLPKANQTLPVQSATDVQLQVTKTLIDSLKYLQTKRSWIPSIHLQAALGSSFYSHELNLWSSNPWYGNSFIGLHFAWPLYQGGYLRNLRQQQHLQAEMDRNTLDQVTQQLSHRHEQLRRRIELLQNHLELRRQEWNSALQHLGVLQDQFESGRVLWRDLTEAEDQVADAQRQWLLVQFDLWSALVEYQRLQGTL